MSENTIMVADGGDFVGTAAYILRCVCVCVCVHLSLPAGMCVCHGHYVCPFQHIFSPNTTPASVSQLVYCPL